MSRFLRRHARAFLLLSLAASLCGFAAAPDVVELLRPRSHPQNLPTARFSHVEHRAHGCFECHPTLFSHPRPLVTHAAMASGGYCGACHDGASARPVRELSCQSCHAK